MNKDQLDELIDKYLAGEASQEETDLLSRYYNSFQQSHVWEEGELGDAVAVESRIFAGIIDQITATSRRGAREPEEKTLVRKGGHNRKVLTFLGVLAAACLIGLILWVALLNRPNPTFETVAVEQNKGIEMADVPIDRTKALLTLADGTTILLDTAGNGEITRQGNTKVTKNGRKLLYHPAQGTDQIVYNNVSTARGGTLQIDLPDGSHAWLNAASSLRFPVAFVGEQRRVEVTGQAYFEVAKNEASPFVVGVRGAEVRVTGTHFDVMAYENESALKITLLEGGVKFVAGSAVSALVPGQQSQLLKNGKIVVRANIDPEKEIAWKNDLFNFHGQDIKTITRQLARWYEVDFIYEQKIEDHFIAKMPRSTTLKKMLELLELTGKVHFKMEGSRIIVKR